MFLTAKIHPSFSPKNAYTNVNKNLKNGRIKTKRHFSVVIVLWLGCFTAWH